MVTFDATSRALLVKRSFSFFLKLMVRMMSSISSAACHIDRLSDLANFLMERGSAFLLIGGPGNEIGSLRLGQMLDAIERIVLDNDLGNARVCSPASNGGEQHLSEIRVAINQRLAGIRAYGEGHFALLSQVDGEQFPALDFAGYGPDKVLSELAAVLRDEIEDELNSTAWWWRGRTSMQTSTQ